MDNERSLPPTNYTPTGYEYSFVNFGLPYIEGKNQYYKLNNGVLWLPNTPTTLMLAMDNLNVIRVGLGAREVMTLNSIMYEMHSELPPHLQSIEVEYLTHNSIIYMKVDDQTSVRLLEDDYVYISTASVLTRWHSNSIKAVTLQVRIDGFRRCCDRFKATFHVKSVMIEDEMAHDNTDDRNLINIL